MGLPLTVFWSSKQRSRRRLLRDDVRARRAQRRRCDVQLRVRQQHGDAGWSGISGADFRERVAVWQGTRPALHASRKFDALTAPPQEGR